MRLSPLLTLLPWCLASPPAAAQDTQGVLLGTLRDAGGRPLPQARVRITSPALLGERMQVTDASGNYRQVLLPPGAYAVTATAPGFIGATAAFYLNAGEIKRQDLALRPIPTAGGATVEVVAMAAQVDKTETITQTSFSSEEIEALTGFGPPGLMWQSMAYNALAMAPGIVGSMPYASIRGGTQQDTQYVINGVSARDNTVGAGMPGTFVLDDTIENVGVVRSPLNGKYGNSAGGMVSVVTRRGTNEWSGSIRCKLTDAAWGALAGPTTDNLGNPVTPAALPQDDTLQRTWEITFSGPIVKDHLTFLYTTRQVPEAAQSATSLALTPGYLDQAYFNGSLYPAYPYQQNQLETGVQKLVFNQWSLFWQMNSDHQLEYTYSYGKDTAPYLLGASTPATQLSMFQTVAYAYYSLAYRGILANNQYLEVRYGATSYSIQSPSGPAPPVWVDSGPTASLLGQAAPTVAALTWWTNSFEDYDTQGAPFDSAAEERTTEAFLADYNLQLEWHGSHNLDLGCEAHLPIWNSTSVDNSYSPQFYAAGRFADGVTVAGMPVGGQYIVFNPATTVLPGDTGTALSQANVSNYFLGFGASFLPVMQVDTGYAQGAVRNPTWSLFANDLYTLDDHFSVMAGLRWDDMELKDPTGTLANAVSLSPRAEGKWDLDGDQKRVVNLSYGDFRGIYNARYYRDNVTTRLATLSFHPWTGAAVPGAPASGMYAVSLAELENPSNYAATPLYAEGPGYFGVDPHWRPEVAHEAQLGFRRACTGGGFWRATLVYRRFGDLSYDRADFSLGRIILANDPDAKREYKGFEFEWNAPLSRHLLLGGSFVYSDLTGNSTFGDDPTFYGSIGQFAQYGDMRVQLQQQGLAQSQFMPCGQLPNSINDVLKTWLSFHLETGRARSTVTLMGTYQSGGHASLTTSYPDPIPPAQAAAAGIQLPSTISCYWNGRGNYTQPDQFYLNLNYALELRIKGRLRWFSQLTIANLLNHPIPTATSYGGGNGVATGGYVANGITTYGTDAGPGGGVGGYRSLNFDMGLKF